ncbi:MAG: hypothetical protein JWQ30_1845 [Sediminibacterium sp.]|nr:hypothetical protein [Sediminibacterium sp.]
MHLSALTEDRSFTSSKAFEKTNRKFSTKVEQYPLKKTGIIRNAIIVGINQSM